MWKHMKWGWILLYGVLMAGGYYSTLTYMVKGWKGEYSYGYLVPLVVLYLLWEKREVLKNVPSQPSWMGFLPLGAGIVLYWLGELGGEYFSLFLSLWLVLVGLCWLHLGWRKIREISFALIMIPTMFRLPSFLHTKATVHLQLLASKWGVAMIQMAGMSAYREGNVIDLGFTSLQVVEACSGLRYLYPLIVLGLLLAHFFRAAWWKRVLLVLSTIPLAIFTNSLRIALTGILSELWSPQVAEGFFHGFSGWFIFMFSLAVLVGERWLLGRIPPAEAAHSAVEADRSRGSRAPAFSPESTPAGTHRLILHGLPILALAFTFVFAHGVEFRERIPKTRPFNLFPVRIGEWKGSRRALDPRILSRLDLTDYIFMDYYNPQGRYINFYAAYYATQRKGESIHTPATCLPGSGWLFEEAGSVELPPPRPGLAPLRVNRAYMQKLDSHQLVYYWFPQRGRILTNVYQLKFFVFWDALTLRRTDGALVRVITPVYPEEKLADTERRLTKFTWQLVPILNRFIPGRTLPETTTAAPGSSPP